MISKRMSKPSGTTISELKEALGCDRKAVYRMIHTMEELGFPVYDEKIPLEREKRWKLEERYLKRLPNVKVPDIELDLSEIVALHLIKGEAQVYRGSEIERKVDSAFAKLGMLVPQDLLEKLGRVRTLFIPLEKFSKDYAGKEEIIDALTEAMLQQRTCNARYHSFSRDVVTSFRIEPLKFFENDGGLYAFVRATDYDEIRILAVERIQELTVTGEPFSYPQGFDPEELLSQAFDIVYDDPIEARIWISSSQAKYVKERRFVRNQNVIEQEDGSIILELKTSGWWDVRRWVLSFGAEAVVLEPEALRDQIVEETRRLLEGYSATGSKKNRPCRP